MNKPVTYGNGGWREDLEPLAPVHFAPRLVGRAHLHYEERGYCSITRVDGAFMKLPVSVCGVRTLSVDGDLFFEQGKGYSFVADPPEPEVEIVDTLSDFFATLAEVR